MATTSIWRVKGWLGKVVIYVENPDKTENPAFFEQEDMTERQAQSLSDVIAYAADSGKTQAAHRETAEILRSFVTGVNCHPNTAREEMMAVKRRFRKENGTVAYHGYQSFAPGEVTPEIAHEIGVKLAQRLWGEKYQVLVATHLDKENHLHNHFVLNTVSFVDGKKYHRTGRDYREMQQASDELCREYRLSVIENPQPGRSKCYGEWRAEQEQRPTWRGIVRADVDEAIRQAMTERQFYAVLRRKGYEIKTGADISVRPPGKERFVRLTRNFGEGYSQEGIRRRILAQTKPQRTIKGTESPQRRYRLRGSLKPARRVKGFRALYFHYCYLLGVFPKNRRQDRQRLHFLLREDLLKLDSITKETRLLAVHHIDTAEQLAEYQESVSKRMESAATSRKALYQTRRTAAVKADEGRLAEVKAEIASLSKELAGLRAEKKLCESIAQRSGVMAEKLKTVREDKNKEVTKDELFRRRGGTGRSVEP